MLASNKIMLKILNYIPFQRLLIFRTISKRWNEAILGHPIFSKKCVVSIQDDPDKALTVFTQTKSKPWKNFKFNSKDLSNATEAQVRFWQTKGIQIKSLVFHHHHLGPVTFLEILLACPNLVELSFTCQQIYFGRHETETQKLIPHLGLMKDSGVLGNLRSLTISDSNSMPAGILRDFLQWGRNLSNLTLSDKNGFYPEPQWDVRNVIQLAEYRAKFLSKLELTGSHILPEHIFALGKIKDLRLRSVRFKFAQVTEKCLSNFFRRQKSLEEIDLSSTQVSEKAFTHPACTFQKLRKLNLSGFTDALEFLSFLSRMPNVENVNLSSSRSTTMTWDILVSGFLPARLRKLQCLDLSHNMTLGTFQKQNLFHSLIICNRQITCLNLSGNISIKDSSLQIIWRNMPVLRVVFLEYLTTITNEGFIGFRQAQVQAAESSGKLDFVDPGLLRSQSKNGAYIGNCPNIQTLSVSYATRLTDLGIQFGIKNLPKLQSLKLKGCGRITDRAMFHLATGCVKLVYLDVTMTNVSSAWVDWVKACLPDLKTVLMNDGDGSASISQGIMLQNIEGRSMKQIKFSDEPEMVYRMMDKQEREGGANYNSF